MIHNFMTTIDAVNVIFVED